MQLPGIITNVTNFGAFVDVGAHQDGLVHISELADQFVKDPADVVKTSQKVVVTVMEVDLERSRIALSMKAQPGSSPVPDRSEKPQEKKARSSAAKPQGFANNPFGKL
jgi:protein Tex